ncbi:LuxR C-terminal-related transcriptional regulator [Streptomyces nogalater]
MVLPQRILRGVRLLAEGNSRKDTASALQIARTTLDRDVRRACEQLGIPVPKYAPLINAVVRDRLITLWPCEYVRLDEPLVHILELVAAGHTNRQIGQRLGLSEDGVIDRLRVIMRLLDARTRWQAVARGWQCGIFRRPGSPRPVPRRCPRSR